MRLKCTEASNVASGLREKSLQHHIVQLILKGVCPGLALTLTVDALKIPLMTIFPPFERIAAAIWGSSLIIYNIAQSVIVIQSVRNIRNLNLNNQNDDDDVENAVEIAGGRGRLYRTGRRIKYTFMRRTTASTAITSTTTTIS